MSDFLTRLVERTFGLSEVVQPSVTSIFGDEMTPADHLSAAPPPHEKTSDVDDMTEPSQLPEAGASLSSVDLLPMHTESDNHKMAERPVHPNTFTEEQCASKENVVVRTGTELSVDSLLSRPKVERELSPQQGEPESHDRLSSDKRIREKEVVLAQTKTSDDVDLPEKPNTRAVKLYSRHTVEPKKPQNPQKPTHNDRSCHERAINKATRRNINIPDKATVSRAGNMDSDNEEYPLTTFASGRPIHPEVSLSQEGSGNSTRRARGTRSHLTSFARRPSGEFPFTHGHSPWNSALRVIRPPVVDHRADERDISSTPSTIKVTIGRIDIRAVKQETPLPPRLKAAPKPRLSLDDYLKQRNRGEG